MFHVKQFLVNCQMAVGKLFVLALISTSAIAGPLDSPQFYNYNSGNLSRVIDLSFGWFRTLDDDQEDMYQQSIIHALEYSEVGEPVTWYLRDASGSAETVYEYPATSGVCRRIHIQAIAYGVQKVKGVTACYNNTTTKWTWHAAK